MPSREDQRFLEQALALAARAGRTSPNPRVGCVVVRDGSVVGAGYHEAAGQDHAEMVAIGRAGSAARGATLYVNLEPCAHHGRTPPCVELLIRSGVRRVVAAMVDPDPRVDGRGFARLRENGIEVEVGCCGAGAAEINAPFLHWHRTGRPLVTLKAACSVDGMLSAAGGNSRWVTGEAARRFAHRLRAMHDAVLVGAGTVRRDDPRLTARLPGVAATPLRVVLSSTLRMDPTRRLFSDSADPVLVYGPRGNAGTSFGDHVEQVGLEEREGKLDLAQALDDLGGRGVQSVLVEGGGVTHAGFLAAGLASRAALFVAPSLLGARGGTPIVDGPAVPEPGHAWRLRRPRRIPLGEDLLLWGGLDGGGGGASG
jgi:diaminohydroxyphosphoribosylaminopyrimidine deaminase/5-amino-6-(5-phosphoribosylamino)uracil reductase